MELYKIGALLASIVIGFDVRIATKSPIHPRLTPAWSEEEEDERRWWYREFPGGPYFLGTDYEFSSSSGYPHNTYHGHTRHFRPSLNLEVGPPRFTDSPQHNPSIGSGGSYTPHAQSPRRKSSSASNESEHCYTSSSSGIGPSPIGVTPYLEYVPQDGYPPPPPPLPQYAEYIRVPPEPTYQYYQEYRGSGMEPGAVYMESYFPEYGRPEVYTVERFYPDYVVHREGYHAYDNPTSSIAAPPMSLAQPPRTPQRVIYTHRRTPSGVSNASNASSSNVNPSFHMDDHDRLEMESIGPPPPHAIIYSPHPMSPALPPHLPHLMSPRHQCSQESVPERPLTLEIPGRCRPSLVSKLKSGAAFGIGRTSPKGWAGSSNSSGTPTNPTPPDSMSASDESSTMSRVRFMVDNETTEGCANKAAGTQDIDKTLLDLPTEGESQDGTIPLPAMMQLALKERKRPTLKDLEKEFLS